MKHLLLALTLLSAACEYTGPDYTPDPDAGPQLATCTAQQAYSDDPRRLCRAGSEPGCQVCLTIDYADDHTPVRYGQFHGPCECNSVNHARR